MGSSTIPEKASHRGQARSSVLRRVGMVLLVAFVVAAAMLDLRVATATGSGTGAAVEVTYAQIARRGLAAPLSVEIISLEGPLDTEATVWISGGYLEQLDLNNVVPAPMTLLVEGQSVGLVFPAQGESLAVLLAGDASPAVPPGMQTFQLIVKTGEDTFTFDLQTLVVP